MTAPFHIEVLASQHNRKGFFRGDNALDRYFAERAKQDIRRHVTACYVALETETGCIAGYYTPSASNIPSSDIPEEMGKRLPHYPVLAVARLGRFAVDKTFQGRRVGGTLLWDALMRSARSEIAVFALVVDAKNDQAESFYRHHGFVSFGSVPKTLILPLSQLSTGSIFQIHIVKNHADVGGSAVGGRDAIVGKSTAASKLRKCNVAITKMRGAPKKTSPAATKPSELNRTPTATPLLGTTKLPELDTMTSRATETM